MRIAVLASGRGSNLQALIDAWSKGYLPVEFVAVGSDNPKAFALERAKKAGIQTKVFSIKDYQDRNAQEEDLLDWLNGLDIQLLLLAGYMKVLGESFINKSKFPVLNIHPSLLPSFPGLHAQRQALEYGVKVTGCTVHFVDEGLDSGPIILQEVVPVFEEDTEESLSERILQVEHQLYPEAVRLVISGKVIRDKRRTRVLN